MKQGDEVTLDEFDARRAIGEVIREETDRCLVQWKRSHIDPDQTLGMEWTSKNKLKKPTFYPKFLIDERVHCKVAGCIFRARRLIDYKIFEIENTWYKTKENKLFCIFENDKSSEERFCWRMTEPDPIFASDDPLGITTKMDGEQLMATVWSVRMRDGTFFPVSGNHKENIEKTAKMSYVTLPDGYHVNAANLDNVSEAYDLSSGVAWLAANFAYRGISWPTMHWIEKKMLQNDIPNLNIPR